MRPKRIIIHHSGTEDSGTVSWNAIRRWHVNRKGWDDTGYHLGFEAIADSWTGQLVYEALLGRPLDIPGAHVLGHNQDSLGVVFIGNYDLVEPPDAMLVYAAKHLAAICDVLDLAPDPRTIIGHRHLAATACPGRHFSVDNLIELVKGQL